MCFSRGAVAGTVLFALLFFIDGSVSVTAQSADEASLRYDQAWLEFAGAEHAFRQGNLGEALRRYAHALNLRPVYPEAFLGMARIYHQQNDIILAKRYFSRALEQAGQLTIPDQVYSIRIEMAQMYDALGEEREYRNTLWQIIEDDPAFSGNNPVGYREAMKGVLYTSGLNRVIVLYRLNFPQSLKAHRLYGRYLLDQGTSTAAEEAIDHLLFAVVEVTGRAVQALIDREYSYQFETLSSLYLAAEDHPDVLAYLRENDLMGALRELSLAITLTTDRADEDRQIVLRRVTEQINTELAAIDRFLRS